jgi:hypothetical protein
VALGVSNLARTGPVAPFVLPLVEVLRVGDEVAPGIPRRF